MSKFQSQKISHSNCYQKTFGPNFKIDIQFIWVFVCWIGSNHGYWCINWLHSLSIMIWPFCEPKKKSNFPILSYKLLYPNMMLQIKLVWIFWLLAWIWRIHSCLRLVIHPWNILNILFLEKHIGISIHLPHIDFVFLFNFFFEDVAKTSWVRVLTIHDHKQVIYGGSNKVCGIELCRVKWRRKVSNGSLCTWWKPTVFHHIPFKSNF